MRRGELYVWFSVLTDLVECKAQTVQEAADIVRSKSQADPALFDTVAELIECKARKVNEAVGILRGLAVGLCQ